MTARNASCDIFRNNGFFESTSYILLFTHSVTFVTIPVSIYALYCVIYVSPRSMSNAKPHLFNLHFWTMVFDLLFNLLNIPLFFFPSPAIVILGYGYNIGIPPRFQIYLLQVIPCVMSFAMIGLFENRFSSIATNPMRIKKRWVRIIFYVFNYSTAFITVIPPYLEEVNLDDMRDAFLKISPCPPIEFFTSRFVVITTNKTYATIFMFIQFVIILPQAAFFTLYTSYLLVYRPSKTISETQQRRQSAFLCALIIQCSIPLGLLMLPVFYIWFTAWTSYYNAAMNNHIVAMLSLHGLLSTLCMLLVHRPYRDNFRSKFKMLRVRPWHT